MNVLLIDVDSTRPNYALMHLSTYYKQQGYKVWLNECPFKPDKVHASTIKRKAMASEGLSHNQSHLGPMVQYN